MSERVIYRRDGWKDKEHLLGTRDADAGTCSLVNEEGDEIVTSLAWIENPDEVDPRDLPNGFATPIEPQKSPGPKVDDTESAAIVKAIEEGDDSIDESVLSRSTVPTLLYAAKAAGIEADTRTTKGDLISAILQRILPVEESTKDSEDESGEDDASGFEDEVFAEGAD